MQTSPALSSKSTTLANNVDVKCTLRIKFNEEVSVKFVCIYWSKDCVLILCRTIQNNELDRSQALFLLIQDQKLIVCFISVCFGYMNSK